MPSVGLPFRRGARLQAQLSITPLDGGIPISLSLLLSPHLFSPLYNVNVNLPRILVFINPFIEPHRYRHSIRVGRSKTIGAASDYHSLVGIPLQCPSSVHFSHYVSLSTGLKLFGRLTTRTSAHFNYSDNPATTPALRPLQHPKRPLRLT